MTVQDRTRLAHDLALIEVAACIDRETVLQAIKAIRDGMLVDISAEEQEIRTASITLLAKALQRNDRVAHGLLLGQ